MCQRVGNGAQKIRAPLINLLVIGNPFSRLALYVVGPLETYEKSRNRFISTIIDLATHYPSAFPLKVHTAAEVAKALISVFTMFCSELRFVQLQFRIYVEVSSVVK